MSLVLPFCFYFKVVSKEVLQHIEEHNQSEKADALDLIEMINKRRKNQTILHYTGHYLLGLKVC